MIVALALIASIKSGDDGTNRPEIELTAGKIVGHLFYSIRFAAVSIAASLSIRVTSIDDHSDSPGAAFFISISKTHSILPSFHPFFFTSFVSRKYHDNNSDYDAVNNKSLNQ